MVIALKEKYDKPLNINTKIDNDLILYCNAVYKLMVLNRLESKVILEVGCGNFRVGQVLMNLLPQDFSYIGIDINKDLIKENLEYYGNQRINFYPMDALEDIPKVSQLVIVNEILQYLSNSQIDKLLKNLEGFKLVIFSEYYKNGAQANKDKLNGSLRKHIGSFVDLTIPPFNLDLKFDSFIPLSEKPGDKILINYKYDKSELYY